MISRKTALSLSKLYVQVFKKDAITGYSFENGSFVVIDSGKLYDFLFSEEYEAWFLNFIRIASSTYDVRTLQDFIMKLHTGESLSSATKDWSWEERENLGQRYLQDMTQDIIRYIDEEISEIESRDLEYLKDNLLRHLELDGYRYLDSKLLAPEADVINVEEEMSLLKELYLSLNLQKSDTVFHHLDLSEEHYIEERWDDSISNSRKYLECVLQEVAAAHHLLEKGEELSNEIYEWSAKVRNYLESEGLLEQKEKSALSKLYGLLSHTGGHPYMAENDQARLLRHLSLTFSQFVLLRYRGYKHAT